jgi:hypothetical protein
MADITAAEAEKQAALEFGAGFTEESPPPEAPAAAIVEPKPETTPAPKVEPKIAAKAPAVVETKAPKYVQITEEQFASLQAAASKTVAIEAQMSKAFGTIGDVQQTVKKLQAATPAGASIEIPKDAFAEMEKDFPELAAQMRMGLEKSLKGVRGTAAGQAADPDAVGKLVTAETVKLQIEALEDAHPTWREIVGAVDSAGKHDQANPFRQWLAKQPAAYQAKINATNSATIIARAIDKFQADTKPAAKTTPAPKAAARNDRIRGAIQPRGDGGQPAPAIKDDFAEGFREG